MPPKSRNSRIRACSGSSFSSLARISSTKMISSGHSSENAWSSRSCRRMRSRPPRFFRCLVRAWSTRMRRIACALTAMKWVFPCQETLVWSTSLRKDSFTRSVGWNVWLDDSRLRNLEARVRRSSYIADISRPTPDRSPWEIRVIRAVISSDGILPLLGPQLPGSRQQDPFPEDGPDDVDQLREIRRLHVVAVQAGAAGALQIPGLRRGRQHDDA